MKQRALTAAAAVIVAGLAANCFGHSTRTPTGPSSPAVTGMTITTPDAIAPGQTVQFTATASLSNGTTADYTHKVAWTASPASVLTIARDTGQATGQSSGDATVQASPLTIGACCAARVMMTVLPANTYRLTGKVLESGLPVSGAAIAVISGIGAGLSTTTDDGGTYRLYGVAGAIQIKFSKAGYDDIVKPFTATQNDVLDFPEAHQTAGIPSLAGSYTLTLTADPTCPTTPTSGIAALPDDFRQALNYVASVTQDGPSVTVTLTDSTIVAGNRFTGRITPDGMLFQIGYYYYPNHTGLTGLITERVSATQEFEFGGQLLAQRSGSGIVGRLNGTLELVAVPYPIIAQCIAPNNAVTMTPSSAQPSRHR
jgi:hypothetical protein